MSGLRRRDPRFVPPHFRVPRFLVRAALLASALLPLSCAGPDHGRKFLLLTIDTLRADRLGIYGNPRGTSPAIDALAAEGVLFPDCLSVSSWTMPAMGTLATGLRPNEHGMVYWHLPLGEVETTLSETLDAAGVRTAFFGNPIPALAGLDRGFDTWQTFEGDDEAAVDAALEWFRKTRGDRFLWVHLLAPHAPYDPVPGTERPDSTLDARTVAYDGEIRTVDLSVERLLRGVGRAAVLLSSDHGETLDDRPELSYDHGKYLFEELVRVPCVLRIPGLPRGVARGRVTLPDLPATVTAWFGAPPLPGSRGRSLLDAATSPAAPFLSWVVEDEPPARKARRWAVHREGYKAVFNLDDGTAELFDLAADPGERRNVSAARPEIVAELRALVDGWREEAPDPSIPFGKRFSRPELERLQSLGYLGGAD